LKILIVGAGAVGGYFGAKLARAGHEVVFTARGENLRTLSERGLAVQSFEGDFVQARIRAIESASGQGPFALVLVCVKAYDTARAVEALGNELEPESAVV
jgi:2-dehydropantoate 2-reductase